MVKVLKKIIEKVKPMVTKKKEQPKAVVNADFAKEGTQSVTVIKEVAVPVSNTQACPNCGSTLEFRRIKGDDYKCGHCGKGYSGWPPPKR